MDIYDVAIGVFLGNVMTLSLVFALRSFDKHDYKAPWLAYAGVLLPCAAGLLVISRLNY